MKLNQDIYHLLINDDKECFQKKGLTTKHYQLPLELKTLAIVAKLSILNICGGPGYALDHKCEKLSGWLIL